MFFRMSGSLGAVQPRQCCLFGFIIEFELKKIVSEPNKKRKKVREKEPLDLKLSNITGNHVDSMVEDAESKSKKKKARTTFTGRQIFELEKQFELKKYLSSSERSEMAKLLNVTETQVSFSQHRQVFSNQFRRLLMQKYNYLFDMAVDNQNHKNKKVSGTIIYRKFNNRIVLKFPIKQTGSIFFSRYKAINNRQLVDPK